MVYTVEVRLINADMLSFMSDMRTWLDHNRFEPDAFRCSRGTPLTTYRLDFKSEDQAMAFAQVFGGRLLGLPTPGPADLWGALRHSRAG
jgi:hypothetical protein